MSDPYAIKMPQLSDTMVEGVVVSWEKDLGASIKRGDIVATVETDKAIMDVEIFRDGFLSGPRAAIDAVVAVGLPIAYIVADSAAVISNQAMRQAAAQPTTQTAPTANHSTSTPPAGVSHTVIMPQLSDTMTEGVLVSWEKKPGERIERGSIVAQVETDKAIMDVEVFRAGYLSGPMAPVEAVVPVGAALGYLVERPDQVSRAWQSVTVASLVTQKPTTASVQPAQQTVLRPPAPRPDNKYATPLARKFAAQLHVNLNNIKGSGPNGLIVVADVEHAQPVERPSEIARQIPAHVMPEIQVAGHGREMSSMERVVSHSMTASLTMPTFRVSVLVATEVLKKAAKSRNISMTVALAKACAMAIGQHKRINWAYQPVDKLVERDNVDIGMAVAAKGGGLVVPVLRHCESRTIDDLAADWKGLVERARKRRLAPEEYANPTFMVSNMGMLGVHYFDAIPTPGTASILAISSPSEQGMPLTVTADHRVVNGAEVALFLNSLKEIIEQPQTWLAVPGPAIPEGQWDYDVVVIGAGPGGEDCARELVEHGLKVAMVNDAPRPGGECLWRGCIPSKAWRAAADLLRDRCHDAQLGVTGTDHAAIHWQDLQKHRQAVLSTRGEMALKTDKGMKIDYIQGYAQFDTEHRLFIDSSHNVNDSFVKQEQGDGSEGSHLSFGCAVIATGAPPFIAPIPGAEQALLSGGLLTSDSVWDLQSLPQNIAIVGAGAIGVEMAQIFQDFGSEVLLVEGQERILAEVEAEIAKQLSEILKQERRLNIYTSAKVEQIGGQPGKMELTYTDDSGKTHNNSCEYVFMATGKRPQLEPLRLSLANVQTDKGVIRVDTKGQTSCAHIYAIGDVIGGYMLAHTASQQGRIAAANILGQTSHYVQDIDCGVIFSRPQAAFVGITLAAAKAKGLDAAEVKMPMSIDAKAIITGKTQGLWKLVADKTSGRIVGVHFLADHADTLIGEAVLMVSAGLTLQQVAQAIHPHPTQTELFGEMARRLLSRIRRTQRMKTKTAA